MHMKPRFFLVSRMPLAAKSATAPIGVDLEACPPVLLYTSVSSTRMFTLRFCATTWSTPIGAVALFAAAGKKMTKKNLGFMCMSYGSVYVASIAMGANRQQTLTAIREAEAHKGPSIILAYAPCMLHGINMTKSQVEQKRAVEAGYWPLYRYNPDAEKPFVWETKDASASYQEFILSENRYKQLLKANPDNAQALFDAAEESAKRRMEFYKKVGEIF